MAVGKISGVMLQSDLARDGTNLSFDSNLVYLDVGLRRLGVNNTSPSYDLDVTGTTRSNVYLGVIGTNAQPYITSVGNLANLTVIGTITTDHLVVNGGTISNVSIGNITFNDTTFGTSTSNANIVLQPNGTGLVVVNTSSALQIPTGNTSQEPGNASAGAIRYNTDNQTLEYYNGSTWVSTTASISTQHDFTPDGTTTTFTLNKSSVTEGIIVNLNGVMQQPVTAYTVSGNQMTFTQAPLSTDVIEVRFITAGVAAQSTGSLALISNVAPAHSNSTGTKGQVAYSSSYLYICVDTNTWIRSAISTSF